LTKKDKNQLTAKQSAFVAEYLIDLNATQAAVRAGYSKKTAGITGFENLRKPNIAAAITEAQAKRAARTEITQDAVLINITRIGNKAEDVDKYGDALKAQEMLAKHLGMFIDKKEISGPGGGPICVIGTGYPDIINEEVEDE